MKKIGVVIVAAGKGERLGNKTPKSLIKIASREMFFYSLAAFQSVKSIGAISIIAPQGKCSQIAKLIFKSGMREIRAILGGGENRQDSVRIGLQSLPCDTDIVLIHDAARPFLVPKQIREIIKLVEEHGSATTARRVGDTLRRGIDKKSTVFLGPVVDRENLWALGTPQGFIYREILDAHIKLAKSKKIVSDDTTLISKPVAVLETDYLNMKITYKSDLELAENLVPIWRKLMIKSVM